jgi:hypothetical protein
MAKCNLCGKGINIFSEHLAGDGKTYCGECISIAGKRLRDEMGVLSPQEKHEMREPETEKNFQETMDTLKKTSNNMIFWGMVLMVFGLLMFGVISPFGLSSTIWFVTILGVNLIFAWIVKDDAENRGMNGWFWGIFTFIFAIIAIPLFLIFRYGQKKDETSKELLDKRLARGEVSLHEYELILNKINGVNASHNNHEVETIEQLKHDESSLETTNKSGIIFNEKHGYAIILLSIVLLFSFVFIRLNDSSSDIEILGTGYQSDSTKRGWGRFELMIQCLKDTDMHNVMINTTTFYGLDGFGEYKPDNSFISFIPSGYVMHFPSKIDPFDQYKQWEMIISWQEKNGDKLSSYKSKKLTFIPANTLNDINNY